MGRVASRAGNQYSGALATLQLLLPGASLVYYGDEIGMEDTEISVQDSMDIRVKLMGQVSNFCIIYIITCVAILRY